MELPLLSVTRRASSAKPARATLLMWVHDYNLTPALPENALKLVR